MVFFCSILKQKLDKFVTELNDKSTEITNLCNEILNYKNNFETVLKLLEQNMSSTNQESKKQLISALIERCIEDSTKKNGKFLNQSNVDLILFYLNFVLLIQYYLFFDLGDQYIFDKEQFDSKWELIKPFNFQENVEMQLEFINAAVKVDNVNNHPKGNYFTPNDSITFKDLSKTDLKLLFFSFL